MATSRPCMMARPGWEAITMWSCAFRLRSIPIPRMHQKGNQSFVCQSFSSMTNPGKRLTRRAIGEENNVCKAENTYGTRTFVRKQHSRSNWGDKKNPFSTPRPRTPLKTEPQLTFEHRLRYLRGPTASVLQRQHSDDSGDNDDTVATISSVSKKKKAKRKRYRPGFQPGDFMCPHCGSHNFRPPEHTLAAIFDSKVVVDLNWEQHPANDPSSSHPVPEPNVGPKKSTQDEGQCGSVGPLHHSSTPETTTLTTTTTTMQDQGSSIEAGKNLPQRQKRTISQKKYPVGATSHCFECGYESSYETSTTGSTTTTTGTPSSFLRHGSKPRGKTVIEATKSLRQDIRLVKPRDYVCPSCQAVNYNNRMYCVGCGVLAPWMREAAEMPIKRLKNLNGKTAKGFPDRPS